MALQKYRDTVLQHNLSMLRVMVEGMEAQTLPSNVTPEFYYCTSRYFQGRRGGGLTEEACLDGVSHIPVNLEEREEYFSAVRGCFPEDVEVDEFPPADSEHLCTLVSGIVGPGMPLQSAGGFLDTNIYKYMGCGDDAVDDDTDDETVDGIDLCADDNRPTQDPAPAEGATTGPITSIPPAHTGDAPSFVPCSTHNADPQNGIAQGYCFCSGSTFAKSTNAAVTPVNFCAYTDPLPGSTTSIQTLLTTASTAVATTPTPTLTSYKLSIDYYLFCIGECGSQGQWGVFPGLENIANDCNRDDFQRSDDWYAKDGNNIDGDPPKSLSEINTYGNQGCTFTLDLSIGGYRKAAEGDHVGTLACPDRKIDCVHPSKDDKQSYKNCDGSQVFWRTVVCQWSQ
ncbi:hypothetical protein IFR05_010728 [Cadophora sp. M221]|nr:hypothetical protein IFR05_010728 [Cadophora sp. M221]